MKYRETRQQENAPMSLIIPDLEDGLNMRTQSGGEEWLLSYADVVTLLLCFFIMFVHFKEVEKVKNPSKIKSESNNQMLISPAPVAEEKIEPKPSDLVDDLPTFSPEMKSILISMNNQLKDLNIGEHKIGKTGLIIYLNEGVFNIGKFDANPAVLEKLAQLSEMIRPEVNRLQIEIQGYADPTPVRASNKSAYKSNLELSVLRSLSILRKFVDQGIPESSMAVTGFGEYKQITTPVSKNEDLFAKNRRVSIRISPKE